ncbi:sulfatase [Prosthecomicrobium sp. N25]|uniref:sulfatase n=1 Tax=Prosthecomicrobium sp. N25 TaxID=3129254 RepID=UPI0030786AA7
MKVVFLLFDSLNRHMLGPYGGTRIPTPNFDRLARRCVTFDGHHVGSLPCMPARRDLQTGRLSFLHRSWGPLEPFDNSFPELLARAGAYSHLVTDHYHYFEDGGATYHNRYDTWDFIRGQEGDPWKAMVQPHWERLREMYHERQFFTDRRHYKAQDIINREFIREEAEFPQVKCFDAGLDFLELNRDADGWLLQIETFDPHEPFMAPARFKEAFKTGWNGPIRDWPRYGRVDELPEECEELRANYYAVVSLCDWQLGRVLDAFDAHDLWKDTALILTTDHGFLLGEHDFWAKNRMNMYEEVAHIPFFFYHPTRGTPGTRRRGLTQNIDLAATFLEMFGAERPAEMQGLSVLPMLDDDVALREAALFGYFGGAINVVDGRYTYHRFPLDIATQEIYQYTVMPTHIRSMFTPEEMQATTLAPPRSFTKGVPLLKVPVIHRSPFYDNYGPGCLLEKETRLYDLAADPGQDTPLADPNAEARMVSLMRRLMAETDAPPEAYARVGLEPAGAS